MVKFMNELSMNLFVKREVTGQSKSPVFRENKSGHIWQEEM